MARFDNSHFVFGVSCLVASATAIVVRAVEWKLSFELLIVAALFSYFGWMHIRFSRNP